MTTDNSQHEAILSMVIPQAQYHIQKAMSEGRLEFIDSDTIKYTSQKWKTKKYTFKQMAETFLDITGTRSHLKMLGIGVDDILRAFREVYEGKVGKIEKIALDEKEIETRMIETISNQDEV